MDEGSEDQILALQPELEAAAQADLDEAQESALDPKFSYFLALKECSAADQIRELCPKMARVRHGAQLLVLDVTDGGAYYVYDDKTRLTAPLLQEFLQQVRDGKMPRFQMCDEPPKPKDTF
jgi:hypothetical protein